MPGIWDTVFLGKNCQRHQRLGTGGLPATSYYGKAPATTPMAKKKLVAIIICKKQTLQCAYCVYSAFVSYCVASRSYVLCGLTRLRTVYAHLRTQNNFIFTENGELLCFKSNHQSQKLTNNLSPVFSFQVQWHT